MIKNHCSERVSHPVTSNSDRFSVAVTRDNGKWNGHLSQVTQAALIEWIGWVSQYVGDTLTQQWLRGRPPPSHVHRSRTQKLIDIDWMPGCVVKDLGRNVLSAKCTLPWMPLSAHISWDYEGIKGLEV